MNKYVVASPIKFEGKVYKPGDAVALPDPVARAQIHAGNVLADAAMQSDDVDRDVGAAVTKKPATKRSAVSTKK